MNVLVDTSVWVSHFKETNPVLSARLLRDEVLIHPFIIGEIACGIPPAPRQRTLADLFLLAHVNEATATEVMAFIDRKELYGRGCGWVDISLLASTLMTPDCRLWTRDKRLAILADQFGVGLES
ncbi:type II toxin-antitoxin system VapC family toxin [Alloalcanivorax mobilis]|uniref:type II toxin-antitoxin system VapC family toxin n=1 Tax=Alloalcanivorax mobilis TaxID=2019569 RepID=UPI000B5B22A5|nr:PIN domain-containing protein [Alloalcanivorax mobilis]ASK34842.1 VapC toxin family PIN domain ribonuclease [Alcanivorax sp. N3-2A]|tara:strand:- start:7727 stop:8098 length:372 start_codon:yes stop_codon:yes gene_type:complete